MDNNADWAQGIMDFLYITNIICPEDIRDKCWPRNMYELVTCVCFPLKIYRWLMCIRLSSCSFNCRLTKLQNQKNNCREQYYSDKSYLQRHMGKSTKSYPEDWGWNDFESAWIRKSGAEKQSGHSTFWVAKRKGKYILEFDVTGLWENNFWR